MAGKLDAMRGEAREWAIKSAAQRLDEPDRIDDDTFNRAIWFSVKGSTPYPAALAGAHGKGLNELHLKLDGNDDD